MINRARTKNQDALENIRTRIDTIISDKSIEQHNNPFEPVYICDAFRNATQALDLDITSLLIIYKLFDRSVIEELDSVYLRVNQYFIDKGILPELRNRVVKSKSNDNRTRNHSNQHHNDSQAVIDSLPVNESVAEATAEQLENSQQNVLSVIQSLLAGQRQQSNTGQIPMMGESSQSYTVQGSPVDTSQLIGALSKIQLQQTAPVDLSARPDAESIKMSLGQQLL